MVFPEEPRSWPQNMELITVRRFLLFIKKGITEKLSEKVFRI